MHLSRQKRAGSQILCCTCNPCPTLSRIKARSKTNQTQTYTYFDTKSHSHLSPEAQSSITTFYTQQLFTPRTPPPRALTIRQTSTRSLEFTPQKNPLLFLWVAHIRTSHIQDSFFLMASVCHYIALNWRIFFETALNPPSHKKSCTHKMWMHDVCVHVQFFIY